MTKTMPAANGTEVVWEVQDLTSIEGAVCSKEQTKALILRAASKRFSDSFRLANKYYYLFENEAMVLFCCKPQDSEFDEYLGFKYESTAQVLKVWESITNWTGE